MAQYAFVSRRRLEAPVERVWDAIAHAEACSYPGSARMQLQKLGLAVLPDRLAIHRLAPEAPIPGWANEGAFVSITRTRDELSIVCHEAAAPDSVARQPGWRCLQVLGPLDLSLVGVLASMIEPLAAAQLSVFAVSTYDTDYLLVRDDALDQVVATLRAAGHVITY